MADGPDSAMCEKQIVVPNNSMLYCSESCRRRDASKPPSNVPDNMYTPSSTPSSIPDSDAFGITTRAIVPRQKPSTYASTSSIPPVLHNAKSDLDPTEWKPDSVRHTDSEASKYLSQFHRSKSGSILPRRPVLQTHMAASMIPTVMAAPSLSHTPTTSSASSSSSIAGTPYEFITPSAHAPGLYITPPSTTEHNGISSSNSSASVPPTLKAVHGKGKAICAPVSPTLVGEVSYEKKWIAALSTEPVAMDGSLKKLLRYQEEGFADAM
ncbi:MAG: hypothetical protein MMC33_008254 [Icmadophila ericetorum]|nr:hypothetical protein [Icmadophila ericetorum]